MLVLATNDAALPPELHVEHAMGEAFLDAIKAAIPRSKTEHVVVAVPKAIAKECLAVIGYLADDIGILSASEDEFGKSSVQVVSSATLVHIEPGTDDSEYGKIVSDRREGIGMFSEQNGAYDDAGAVGKVGVMPTGPAHDKPETPKSDFEARFGGLNG